MKIKLLFLISSLFLIASSCTKETSKPQTGIVGEWKLVEELVDPGDGSGTFQPVSSNKVIVFLGNGTFQANDDMCFMSSQVTSTHTGTYDTTTETFSPNNCTTMAPMSYQYSVNGNTLILTYPCICGCQQKYTRI